MCWSYWSAERKPSFFSCIMFKHLCSQLKHVLFGIYSLDILVKCYKTIPDLKSKMNPKRNPTLTIALTHTFSLTLIRNSNLYAYMYPKPAYYTSVCSVKKDQAVFYGILCKICIFYTARVILICICDFDFTFDLYCIWFHCYFWVAISARLCLAVLLYHCYIPLVMCTLSK